MANEKKFPCLNLPWVERDIFSNVFYFHTYPMHYVNNAFLNFGNHNFQIDTLHTFRTIFIYLWIILLIKIMAEDDALWPQPDRVGRQELEIVIGIFILLMKFFFFKPLLKGHLSCH